MSSRVAGKLELPYDAIMFLKKDQGKACFTAEEKSEGGIEKQDSKNSMEVVWCATRDYKKIIMNNE